jgi:outer membrane receptor protein involved in Fe transport
MQMLGGDFNFNPNNFNSFSGNFFYRDNSTDAFNGDGSEYATCNFLSGRALIEEIEEDDLEEFNLDDDDLCNNQFSNSEDLESYINGLALSSGDDDFNLEDFTDDLSGSGVLSDEAINNLSKRDQKSRGFDFQWRNSGIVLGIPLNSIVGIAHFKGASDFNSVLELSRLDPVTRLTTNLGTGTFVDSEATSVSTLSKSNSIYLTSTAELSASISATLSARYNNTDVELQDLSGVRPELNGKHNFSRTNPSFGITWQASDDHALFTSLSQAARAPTPIELACNEGVFEIARRYSIARGEDPDDIDFECRLPNAFLADPPLEQVITTSAEIGARGRYANVNYELGLFSTTNRNDILFQTTGRSTGLFANISKTKRQGVELSFNGSYDQFRWIASYNYLEATFEDNFKALSPNHAFTDENGEISIQAGASIPGIPKQQFKLIGDFQLSKKLEIGFVFQASSKQYLRGDESNQLPSISGYSTTNLRANYTLSSKLNFFARIKNVFDREYENFGLLGEDPSELDAPIVQGMSVPRFLGPAMPRAAYVGLSYFF